MLIRVFSRSAHVAGLVAPRQTFVRRCHGDDGWPPRAEASSNLLFGGAGWRHARDNPTQARSAPQPRQAQKTHWQVQCIVRPVLCSRSKLTWLSLAPWLRAKDSQRRSISLNHSMPPLHAPSYRINPACGSRFLSRIARRAGLVALRQTFVRRRHRWRFDAVAGQKVQPQTGAVRPGTAQPGRFNAAGRR